MPPFRSVCASVRLCPERRRSANKAVLLKATGDSVNTLPDHGDSRSRSRSLDLGNKAGRVQTMVRTLLWRQAISYFAYWLQDSSLLQEAPCDLLLKPLDT